MQKVNASNLELSKLSIDTNRPRKGKYGTTYYNLKYDGKPFNLVVKSTNAWGPRKFENSRFKSKPKVSITTKSKDGLSLFNISKHLDNELSRMIQDKEIQFSNSDLLTPHQETDRDGNPLEQPTTRVDLQFYVPTRTKTQLITKFYDADKSLVAIDEQTVYEKLQGALKVGAILELSICAHSYGVSLYFKPKVIKFATIEVDNSDIIDTLDSLDSDDEDDSDDDEVAGQVDLSQFDD